MKKFLKVFLISILVLLAVVAIGIFIFLKTFKLDNFKNQLLDQASHALGTPVEMETLDFKFSLEGGIVLRASGISIEDRPEFSQEKIFSLKEANLQLDFKSFILNHQIIVTQVVLEEPQIHLIRNKNGEINAQKLIPSPRQKALAETKTEETNAEIILSPGIVSAVENLTETTAIPEAQAINTESSQAVSKPSEPLSLPDFLIRSIVVKDGILFWTDELMEPAMKVLVKNIDLKILNFSFDKEFPFEVNISILSDQDNIKAQGFLKIDKNNSQISLNKFEAKTDLSAISFEQLFNLYPQISQIGLEEPVGGDITVTINDLTASAQGLTKFSSEANIQTGRIKLKQLASAFEDINGHANISESAVNLTQSSINFAGGMINATVKLEDYLKEQKFQVNTQMDRVLIEKFIDQTKLPVKVQGKINADFNMGGTGFTLESLKQSLNGGGHVEVVDGKLVGKNILRMVVQALSIDPEAKEKIEQALPQEYKDILESPDTILDKVSTDLTLQSDTIVVKPVEVEAQGFLMRGSAEMNFEQNISVKAALIMTEDLSQIMVTAVPLLSYLLNEEKKFYIPFTPYQGPVSGFKMRPDMAYIGEHAVKAVGDQKLDELIDENVPEPLRDLLKDIKNEIFKGF